MKYCKKCLYPDTKPLLIFDENGICDACKSPEKKAKIDWDSRRKDLAIILEKYRSKSNGRYDCIIPISGGKDSHFQVHVIVNEFGLKPLLVNFHPRDLIPLGRKNIENIKNIGVDCIEFTPNPHIYKKMEKFGLIELGDVNWPEHVGIFTVPFQVAVAYQVPLIIWGENPQMEYGGPGGGMIMDKEWLEKYGVFWFDKIKPTIMTEHGIDIEDLKAYNYPSDEELKRVGVTGIFLGQYIKYDIDKILETVEKIGFSRNPEPKEGTYTNWENLDTKFTGMHDYFKWIKYGYGRATDHASLDIRAGKITREEGLKLVKEFEGKIPEKYMQDFLEDMEITREEFYRIVDKFANKELFKTDAKDNLVRDENGNIEKLVYDNI